LCFDRRAFNDDFATNNIQQNNNNKGQDNNNNDLNDPHIEKIDTFNNNDNYNTDEKVPFCCNKCRVSKGAGNKKCVCVVPRSHRRVNLDKEGCRVCGCKGCTIEDKEFNENPESFIQKKGNKTNNDPRDRKKSGHDNKFDNRDRRRRRYSRSYSRDRSRSRERHLNNISKSPLWELLYDQLNSYPPLFGLGIPQRSRSYLRGEP